MITIVKENDRVQKLPYKEAKHIEVVVCPFGKEEQSETKIMHESQVQLLKVLNQLQRTAGVYPDNMDAIYKIILDFANSEYLRGIHEGIEMNQE